MQEFFGNFKECFFQNTLETNLAKLQAICHRFHNFGRHPTWSSNEGVPSFVPWKLTTGYERADTEICEHHSTILSKKYIAGFDISAKMSKKFP